MGLIARLRWAQRARLVAEALGDATPVRVVGCPPLAEVLAESGKTIAATDGSEAGAVVGTSEAVLREEVRAGGVVVLVGRGAREEAMRQALCAGLVELEQRVAGRAVVTSGRTKRLP